MSAYSSFFRIKKESTTKHPKENFLNLKENLEEKRDLELRAEGSPREKVLMVRSRNCRSSCLQLFSKIGVLKFWQYSEKSTFVAGLQGCNSVKKRLQTQVFSCEYYEIFKNSFFYRHPLVAASGIETYY